MIPVNLSINFLYVVCSIILLKNILTGYRKGIINGGANLLLIVLNINLSARFVNLSIFNNPLTTQITKYIHKYITFWTYADTYYFIKWIICFLSFSLILSFLYSRLIYPFIKKMIYDNSYMTSVDKLLGGCIYLAKGILVCYLLIEVCSSPLLFRDPIDKAVVYQPIDQTLDKILK